MPPNLVPHRSGVHRAACFALYRALVRRNNSLPLDAYQRSVMNLTVKATFKKNKSLNASSKIIATLRLGYETLRVFESLHAQPEKLREKFDLLFMRKPKSSHPFVQPETEKPAKRIPSPVKQSNASSGPPRVWPHPNNKPVLSRPFLNLTGRRHVPVFTAGCEVPFLRYKKPQSPFLSRIIRDTIVAREKRTKRMHEVNILIQDGTIEDQWDLLVERLGGPRRLKNEPSWADEAKSAWHCMDSVNKLHRDKALGMAVKLQKIVVKEEALVEEDKKKWRDEKFAKWLERKKQKAATAVVT